MRPSLARFAVSSRPAAAVLAPSVAARRVPAPARSSPLAHHGLALPALAMHITSRRQHSTNVTFVAPQAGQETPVLVEFLTEEQAASMKQIWPSSISEDFTGKDGQSIVYYASEDVSGVPKRFLWVGLGKKDKLSSNTLRKATATAVDRLRSLKMKSATITLDPTIFADKRIGKEVVVNVIANAAISSNYAFDLHLTSPEAERPQSKLDALRLTFKTPNGTLSETELNDLNLAVQYAKIYSEATNYARDLANTRADVCNPEFMEKEARKLVEAHPDLFEIEVLQMADLKAKGLNLLAAVGQGASVPPRLVILKYKGAPEDSSAPLAILGKGITFDTGGLNIKPTGFIEEMYMDMGGSAAVLGALSALPKLSFKKNVVGVLCLAENAVSDRSVFPMAIIKSYKGLTVEIGNTDAEGRLIMADGLSYLQKNYKPSHIIDLATLTGACVVALGEYAAGLFTNDDTLRDEVRIASDQVFERVWHLPLFEEYSAEMKGTQSDLKNSGKSRYGGACTAAAFLKEFIDEGVKWAHIDIAGPAMTSEKRAHVPKGGTGFGAQLLLRWLQNRANADAQKAEDK